MDKKKCMIAIASSDGIVVNSHFGRAKEFYIYELDNKQHIHFVEKRSVTPVCMGGSHDDEKLKTNLKKLQDCKYLLTAKIGNGASGMAENFGIECYEIPGIIEESIEQLIKYIKIKKLFE